MGSSEPHQIFKDYGWTETKIREPKSGIYIVGEGITEQYYFSHIKILLGIHCTIKPRFLVIQVLTK